MEIFHETFHALGVVTIVVLAVFGLCSASLWMLCSKDKIKTLAWIAVLAVLIYVLSTLEPVWIIGAMVALIALAVYILKEEEASQPWRQGF